MTGIHVNEKKKIKYHLFIIESD